MAYIPTAPANKRKEDSSNLSNDLSSFGDIPLPSFGKSTSGDACTQEPPHVATELESVIPDPGAAYDGDLPLETGDASVFDGLGETLSSVGESLAPVGEAIGDVASVAGDVIGGIAGLLDGF